jgi:hypothetical protein
MKHFFRGLVPQQSCALPCIKGGKIGAAMFQSRSFQSRHHVTLIRERQGMVSTEIIDEGIADETGQASGVEARQRRVPRLI